MSPLRRRFQMLVAPLLVGLVALFIGTVSVLASTGDRSGAQDQVSTHPDHTGGPVVVGALHDVVVPAAHRSTSGPWAALPLVTLLAALVLVPLEHSGARWAARTAGSRATRTADGLRLRAPPTL